MSDFYTFQHAVRLHDTSGEGCGIRPDNNSKSCMTLFHSYLTISHKADAFLNP